MALVENNGYTGTYNQRVEARGNHFLDVSKQQKEAATEKITDAIGEIKALRGDRKPVEVSKEDQAFLYQDEAYQKMKNDVDMLYAKNAQRQEELQKKNPEDPFWGNTGNQWLIFSKELDQSGFYQGMSDKEVKEIEEILARVTAGMDHVSRSQYETGIEFSDYYGHGNNYFMSSEEVDLELESSAGALRYFSEKYVPEEKREAFGQLIDQYYSHNSEILKEYKSPMESFERAVSGQGNDPYSKFIKNNYKQDSNIVGGATHTEEEHETYQTELKNLFKLFQLEGADHNSIWNQIEDTFADYASGTEKSKEQTEQILEKAKGTFERMESYWSRIGR